METDHPYESPASSNGTPPSQESGATTPDYRRPFITITMLFFLWGFITVMNDVLIPYLKESFELTFLQAGLVQFAFFGAFFVVSLLYYIISLATGDPINPINRIGYKTSVIIALLVCGSGLFNSIMWSNIFTLAIKDLKQYTSQGSSLLVMMIVGGALVPLVMGYAADELGIQHAFAIPIVCYLYIAFYGFVGYRVKEVQAV